MSFPGGWRRCSQASFQFGYLASILRIRAKMLDPTRTQFHSQFATEPPPHATERVILDRLNAGANGPQRPAAGRRTSGCRHRLAASFLAGALPQPLQHLFPLLERDGDGCLPAAAATVLRSRVVHSNPTNGTRCQDLAVSVVPESLPHEVIGRRRPSRSPHTVPARPDADHGSDTRPTSCAEPVKVSKFAGT